jgi:hypothetical protein
VRCLPSVRAVVDSYRSDPPGEASAHEDVAKNMSDANFANCWRAEVNGRESGLLVRNEAAASWLCGEWPEVQQKSVENGDDSGACEIEIELELVCERASKYD